jgi:radical SAM/Cys-rich protein
MLDTRPLLLETEFPAIKRSTLETLQVNLGYLCNLSCTHCHVNAGPTRKELMSEDNIDLIITFLKERGIKTLDLTGGAPEMNPNFRKLVQEARALGVHVIDRCNLTILQEPGYEDLAGFLAENEVEVVASLPCYTQDNVDKQRGKGTFDGSIEGLKKLNSLGYGKGNDKLVLSLVYNPGGAFLPPPQHKLEADYKKELQEHFDIYFDQLFTITNMPISRFGSVLLSKGEFDSYMELLKGSYSQDNLSSLMCRSLISVDYQGYVYDCDFNQMLDMPMVQEESDLLASDKQKVHLKELLDQTLEGQSIVVADHCYGCTAGQGSSCGGALD